MRWVLPLLLVGLVVSATDGPVAVIQEGQAKLTLSNMPMVLNAKEIRPELDSGLTNTVLISVEARAESGAKLRGGATIDIRYEPWDEIYEVHIIQGDGIERRTQVGSFEDLLGLWDDLSLGVLQNKELTEKQQWSVNVHLSFVPFSQTEQRQAQLWIEKSLDRPPSADQPASANSRALSVLVATSIKRRTVVEYRWKTQAVWEKTSEVKNGS